jgi:hypothetical protein
MPVAVDTDGLSVPRLSINDSILIEAVDDGGLVFDMGSGATTLINNVALGLMNTLRQLGCADEFELSVAVGAASFAETLASLEKIQLIHRC